MMVLRGREWIYFARNSGGVPLAASTTLPAQALARGDADWSLVASMTVRVCRYDPAWRLASKLTMSHVESVEIAVCVKEKGDGRGR
jgi:hypothetical protein